LFFVEQYLASRSYLTYQSELGMLSLILFPNKSTVFRLVNHFHRVAANMKKGNACIGESGGYFQHLITCFLFPDFSVIRF
jgi:hypothetical protein